MHVTDNLQQLRMTLRSSRSWY